MQPVYYLDTALVSSIGAHIPAGNALPHVIVVQLLIQGVHTVWLTCFLSMGKAGRSTVYNTVAGYC